MNTNHSSFNTIQEKTFHAEYEYRINKLKLQFINNQKESNENSEDAIAGRDTYNQELQELRNLVHSNRKNLNLEQCSSLLAIPTQRLADDELFIHRVWMGGALSEDSKNATLQWGMAIKAIKGKDYDSILWVWDEQQLQDDPLFVRTGGRGKYTIGSYSLDRHPQHVNSLKSLALNFSPDNFQIIRELHDQGYYATLSDYFRFLILIQFGGIYMDSDTIPYKPATIFLSLPEIPDFFHYKKPRGEEEKQLFHLSWMNLFFDETGLIAAKKNNESLQVILDQLNRNYKKIPNNIPIRNKEFEFEIFDEFYEEWKNHLERTSLSHDKLIQNYSVLFNGEKEPVICGVRGMRLLLDIITDIEIPLSPEEQKSYDRCVDNLNRCGWKLDKPSDFEEIAEVFHLEEVPRMAYPPQIRSDIEHYHYYNVLCEDDNLDRVNALFSEYLIDHNAQEIINGNYWSTVGSDSDSEMALFQPEHLIANEPVVFRSGKFVGDKDKKRMAKLIFETSYLEFCSAENKLKLDFVDLQQKQNIDPYLDLLHGIYDKQGDFVGFFISGSSNDFDHLQLTSYYRDEMKAIDDAYDEFVEKHMQESDYFLSCAAIEEDYRGKGVFNQIFEYSKRSAIEKGCKRIILPVYENNDAINIYLKKGFKTVGTFDYVYDLFFDKVHLMEYTAV